MHTFRKLFPEIILDNDEIFLSHLSGIIEAVDEFAELEIVKSMESYNFRLISSLPKYNKMLLEEILKFHNMYGIRLNLSKSIKTSNTINFSISL